MLRSGYGVALCALALLTLGVVMVASAGLGVSGREEASAQGLTTSAILMSRPGLYMALSVVAMLIVGSLPWGRWLESPARSRWVPWLLPIMVGGLAMVYLPHIGREVNGSRRWVQITSLGLSAQPSEIAKWGMVLVLAWFAAWRGPAMASFTRGFLPGAALLGLMSAIVAKEDLGTGALIFASGCVLLLAGGARVVHFLPAVPIALAGLALAIITSPYRLTRLTTFLDPYREPEGAGYHMIQSLVAIANGELFGRGLGFGLQKFGYLPEDTTDFLFAIICEELGLAGAGLVIFLYVTLLWCGWSIVRAQRALMPRLVGLGVVVTIGTQAVINLLVVTGLAPTKGIALPLLSNGGTGWILTSASLGLLIAFDRAAPMAAASTPIGAPASVDDSIEIETRNAGSPARSSAVTA